MIEPTDILTVESPPTDYKESYTYPDGNTIELRINSLNNILLSLTDANKRKYKIFIKSDEDNQLSQIDIQRQKKDTPYYKEDAISISFNKGNLNNINIFPEEITIYNGNPDYLARIGLQPFIDISQTLLTKSTGQKGNILDGLEHDLHPLFDIEISEVAQKAITP